jgi:type III secretion protein W
MAQHADQARSGQATGSHRGEQVSQVQDAMSLLADAAEELTFSASETVEKKTTERKAKKKGRDGLERVQFYVDKLPDMGDPRKLRQLWMNVKSQPPKSAKDLRQQVGREYGDVSHQHAALSYMLEMAEEEGNVGLKDLCAQALAELEKEHGPEIRAGYNVTVTAKEFEDRGLGDTGSLRDLYRRQVLGHDALSDAYRSVMDRYGEKEFGKAVSFLIKALGADMQAKGPSTEPAELKRINDDLFQLEVMGNIHRDCGELLERMDRVYGQKTSMNAHGLMDRTLTLKDDKWIRGDNVADLVRDAGVRDTEAQVHFLREYGGLCRQLPLKVFNEPENRSTLLDAVQEAQDAAIEREEEELG